VLNPSQVEAVVTLEGPVLVIAGAGSGKTRTLVYRVARLVEAGVAPESILLLTFTRKAAQEMLERAAGLSDARCRFVSGGTFHSIAHRVLRTHAELLGYKNSFAILDRPDMEEVIQSLVPELGIPKGTARFPKRSTLANIISKAANRQQTVERLVTEEYGQFLEFVKKIERLESLYGGYKRSNQMMDYDDLILNLRKLLNENVDIREHLGRQYGHVMVDEYQDTNAVQADIVKWLAHGHRNIMVVGDDSQSIYSFRGANFRNMFDFPSHFPETKIIKLEENYRSTQPILSLTNALMEKSSEKYTKCLFTRREGGDLPRIIDTRTEPEQAIFICSHVKAQMQQGRPISDFAVLFRAGYHSFELEAELTRQGIPYVKYGGFKFLESAHIKDFLAHLRILTNRDDTVSWVRVLRLVKNVGLGKSRNIIDWIRANQIPAHGLGKWPGKTKGDSGFETLARFLARLGSKKKGPKAAAEAVMEYYAPILKEKYDDHPRRQRELEQLIPMASRYKKLENFLDDLILEPPTSSSELNRVNKDESLTLSTVHSAKGLEWPYVFVIWVAEGRFPAARAYDNPEDLEEERRLMYVAATRAKDRLTLCYPGSESRYSWPSHGEKDYGAGNGLSSFLKDLGNDVASYEVAGTLGPMDIPRRGKIISMEKAEGPAAAHGLKQGDRVKHPAFGAGVVSKFVSKDKVEVLFSKVGRKLLHLEYTILEKV
jgi:DNA helicase-2/ATP-dependent DNA helicase PcrA